ncbi:hypothetical protein U1Q18_029410, partial [Sarracenia purpurea var. burkii]
KHRRRRHADDSTMTSAPSTSSLSGSSSSPNPLLWFTSLFPSFPPTITIASWYLMSLKVIKLAPDERLNGVAGARCRRHHGWKLDNGQTPLHLSFGLSSKNAQTGLCLPSPECSG